MTMQAPQPPPAEATPQTMMVVSREAAFESYKRGLEPNGIDAAYKLAGALAKTRYCGVETAEEALAKMMFGRELGLTVMNSMRSVYVVNGRPGLDANVMHALCLQSPVCEYFEIVETTNKVATYRAKRKGRPEVVLSWTIEQADAAGLLGGRPDPKKEGKLTEAKDNWRNYPENMLRARCIANLARIVFPEAINGMHTPDELDHDNVSAPAAYMPIGGPIEHIAELVDSAQSAYEKRGSELLARIRAASSVDEKKVIRAEIAKLTETGELPNPWLADARALYNERFAAKKTVTVAASAPEAAADAPAAAAPPPPAPMAPVTATAPPVAAAAPAPAGPPAVAPPPPVVPMPPPPSSDDVIDRGDNPDHY